MVGASVVPFRFKAAKFLSNRFSVGIDFNPGFSQRLSDDVSGFNLLLLPTARYYFVAKEGLKDKKIAFFTDFNIGTAISFSRDGKNKTSGWNSQLQAGIAPGLIYVVNKNVSVDAGLRINYYDNKSYSSSLISTTPEFGLQVYLPGRKGKKSTS